MKSANCEATMLIDSPTYLHHIFQSHTQNNVRDFCEVIGRIEIRRIYYITALEKNIILNK